MAAGTVEAVVTGRPRPPRRRRWLAIAIPAVLAAAYLGATGSTHAALSGGSVGWSAVTPASAGSLTEPTAAEYAEVFPTSQAYSRVLWTRMPGGEMSFGFQVHNGGPVPVTLLGVGLRILDPDVNPMITVGTLLNPGLPHSGPFHPVSLGPGDSVWVGLTERVTCPAIIRHDAQRMVSLGQADTSFAGDATSPVVVRYRVLGLTMSQTLSLDQPLLIMLPYTACR
jgi:hypothetical protein